jgi:hypothetical protein
MTIIHVPRPDPRTAIDPTRPVNALLKAQIQHLHAAEINLPLRRQTDIYINAIKTEGEAAEYIRQVTTAIQEAHAAAAARRKRGIAIAAAAEKPARKAKGASSKKNKTRSREM